MKINSIARINAWLVMNGNKNTLTQNSYTFKKKTWNIFACSFIFGIFKGNASTSVGKLFMSLILIWSCFFSVIVSYLFYVYARTKIKTRKSTSSAWFFFPGEFRCCWAFNDLNVRNSNRVSKACQIFI